MNKVRGVSAFNIEVFFSVILNLFVELQILYLTTSKYFH